jgi:hypothetical protein
VIPSRPHLRNLAITVLAIGLVLQFALWKESARAQALLTWDPTAATVTQAPGTANFAVTFTLTNNSTITRNITISSSAPSGVTLILSNGSVQLSANSNATITLFVTYASTVPPGTVLGAGSLVANSSDTPSTSTTAPLTFVTTGTAPTQTPTTTTTPTPTATVGPSPTPLPACLNGVDNTGTGRDKGSAKFLLVNVTESHGICTRGEENWFKFGAVNNKVYTIDVPTMDAGLDLSLELYDEDGNRLASNDDFFLRNPSVPDAKDIKPRIQSWRSPKDGTYYIRVRDTLNIGGDNKGYTIVVQAESYGPTPVTVPELCRDLFEEDGLPEEAKLITSNESQNGRVLCPTGDADWVKFFALRGKVYYIYTDTRIYPNKADINGNPPDTTTEAGADTVIYLADRDGVSILDFNDDIEGSLDSQIRFTPSADGFYYLQIKNVGDIGNQFIKYDLTVQLCFPNQECGRSPIAPVIGPTASIPSNSTPQPTATTSVFLNPTLTPTSVASGNFSQSSLKPGPLVNGPLTGFADPAFERVWQRNDRPIAEQRANRSWTWGPRGLMARTEGYIQAASGLRQVQYFDKGRMEVNDPRGDRNSQWFVTTGLLVIELISGRTQIGDGQFVQHPPADIPIAGDQGDPNAPTYASFGGVSGQQPGDRSGQFVGETLSRTGQVGAYAGPQRPEAQLAHFVPESGHNIPQVFWNYLNASGTIYEGRRYSSGTLLNWVFTLGYPISEPYWTRIKVGGVDRDVLVQPFQRRVLTYSPDNPSGWQVEMGNVGRHYYLWRYGEALPS